MILTYRFVKDGGYDNLSDAFYIECGKQTIATVDIKDFHPDYWQIGPIPEVEPIVKQLVDGFNLCPKEENRS